MISQNDYDNYLIARIGHLEYKYRMLKLKYEKMDKLLKEAMDLLTKTRDKIRKEL